MPSKITIEQVNQIVNNLHHNPFEILGCHLISERQRQKTWVIRAYLPKADSVSVMLPDSRRQYPMKSVHHPHFF